MANEILGLSDIHHQSNFITNWIFLPFIIRLYQLIRYLKNGCEVLCALCRFLVVVLTYTIILRIPKSWKTVDSFRGSHTFFKSWKNVLLFGNYSGLKGLCIENSVDTFTDLNNFVFEDFNLHSSYRYAKWNACILHSFACFVTYVRRIEYAICRTLSVPILEFVRTMIFFPNEKCFWRKDLCGTGCQSQQIRLLSCSEQVIFITMCQNKFL